LPHPGTARASAPATTDSSSNASTAGEALESSLARLPGTLAERVPRRGKRRMFADVAQWLSARRKPRDAGSIPADRP
jgi:hypothetical protein